MVTHEGIMDIFCKMSQKLYVQQTNDTHVSIQGY